MPGQHVVTAIFERDYNINTISWSLGPEVSYIEFDAKVNVTPEQIAKVEKRCNELIAAATPVHVHILGSGDIDAPDEVRTNIDFEKFNFEKKKNCKFSGTSCHQRSAKRSCG